MAELGTAAIGAGAALGAAAYAATTDLLQGMRAFTLCRGEVTEEDWGIYLALRTEARQKESEYEESISAYKETPTYRFTTKWNKKGQVRQMKKALQKANRSLRLHYYESTSDASDTSSVTAVSGSPPRSRKAHSDEDDKRILSWAEDVANNSDSDGLNAGSSLTALSRKKATSRQPTEAKRHFGERLEAYSDLMDALPDLNNQEATRPSPLDRATQRIWDLEDRHKELRISQYPEEDDTDYEDMYVGFSNTKFPDIDDLEPHEMEYPHVDAWARGDEFNALDSDIPVREGREYYVSSDSEDDLGISLELEKALKWAEFKLEAKLREERLKKTKGKKKKVTLGSDDEKNKDTAVEVEVDKFKDNFAKAVTRHKGKGKRVQDNEPSYTGRMRSFPDDPATKVNDSPLKSVLRPPKLAPSAWQLYFTDWIKKQQASGTRKLNAVQAAKEAGQEYACLSWAEKEPYKRRSQAMKEDREREHEAYLRTLTPDDIKRENLFRAAQRKAGKSRKRNIKDPNAPKKPLIADIFGDETGTAKQSVLAAAKWRSMTDAEKQPFLAQAEVISSVLSGSPDFPIIKAESESESEGFSSTVDSFIHH